MSEPARQETWPRSVGTVAALCLGAVSVTVQALCTREALVIFAGNELVLGLVLAAWHLGLVGGALLAARLAPRHSADAAIGLLWALALLLPMALFALRTGRVWSGVPTGELLGLGRMSLIALGCISPLSALIGALFPTTCALVAESAQRTPAPASSPALAIGRVYGLEALASLGAGLLLTLLALPLLGVERCATLSTLIALAAATAIAELIRRRPLAWVGRLLLGVAVVAVWVDAPLVLGEHARAARFAASSAGYQRLLERDSRYQNLVVATPGSGDTARALFTDGRYAFTVPDPYAQARRLHLVMAQHPAPRQVLVVGGPTIGGLGEAFAHGLERLDYVELDPEVVSLLLEALPATQRRELQDPRFHPISTDVRHHLRSSEARYDLVFVDLPTPTSAMLNRAYTREFFSGLRRTLRPGGCVVLRGVTADAYLCEAVARPTASIFATLRAVFPHVIATPGEESLLAAAEEAGVVSVDPQTLMRRLQDRQLQSRYFAVEELPLLLPPQRTAELRAALLATAAPINTDLRPVTYYFNLVLFGHYTARPLAALLGWLLGLSWWATAAALLVLGALLAALLRHRARAGRASAVAPLFSLATTGLLGSAECIALLYAFQNSLGFIYDAIALLVGLFMFGLAAGSLGGTRFLTRGDAGQVGLLVGSDVLNLLLAGALGATLILVARLPPTGAAIAIGAALVICGAGVGLAFVATATALRGHTGRVAGVLDATDCLGAMLGALATGVVAVPLFGAAGTAAVLVALKAASLMVLVVDRGARAEGKRPTSPGG